MSILGIDIVKELGLIENLSDREIENPEGCGLDVRINKVFEISEGQGFLHKEKRKTPDYKLLGEYGEEKDNKVVLEPGKIYAAETIEKVKTPLNIFGRFFPRHTLFKNGILVLGQKMDPGYKGKFGFVLINLSGKKFEIELGSRIAQMVFYQIEGKTSKYRGQWQGGRVFIDKEEIQV